MQTYWFWSAYLKSTIFDLWSHKSIEFLVDLELKTNQENAIFKDILCKTSQNKD